jgi:hypothetical protein
MSWLRDALEGFYADEKIRATEMAALSPRLKMEYLAEDPHNTLPFMKEFKLGQSGSRKKIKNALIFKDEMGGKEFRIFDYYYTISTGKSSHTYRQTVFLVYSKELALPEFMLKPESFFHKIGAFLGFKDINFEREPKFSGQYHLKGPEEDFIRGLMTEKVLHYFTINDGWNVEGINYYLILYQPNVMIHPSWIERFYLRGREIYEMLVSEQPTFDLPENLDLNP